MPSACKKSYLDHHDIFIAYASSEFDQAASLCQVLEGQGFDVFIDKRTPAGKRFRPYVVEQLQEASVVVMLWTEAFSERDFTMDEVDLALKQKTYFGVMMESLKDEQLYGTNQYQRFYLTDWKGDPRDPRLDELSADIRHFIDERRQAEEVLQTETTAATQRHHQGEVDEYREELLSCLVDRTDQTARISEILSDNPAGSPVFLIEGYERHWLRALAVHLALLQTGNYALLEDANASLSSAMQASLLETGDIGKGRNAFQQLLATMFRLTDRSEQAVATELHERVMHDKGVTVIYVPLLESRDRRHLPEILSGALEFLGRLPPFESGRRLLVLFGINCQAEHSFNPMNWWRDRRLKRLCDNGLTRLEVPEMIEPTHIETWFNKLPERDRARYRFSTIDQKVQPHFGSHRCYYDDLKYPLIEALQVARDE